MKNKKMFVLVYIGLAVLFAVLSVSLISYFYDNSVAFRGLFEGDNAAAGYAIQTISSSKFTTFGNNFQVIYSAVGA